MNDPFQLEMKTIVTFGEIMGRLCPAGHKRFIQAMPGTHELTFAGAEANVAASLAILGAKARFATVLPNHTLGDACINTLRGIGVDTSEILRGGNRLGLYFVEKGANQRPGNVIYDREFSAISMAEPSDFDWERIYKDAVWMHTTGITPALSQKAFESTLAAVQAAKAAGLTVSCDLNFRHKLWRWERDTDPKVLARRCLEEILQSVDIVIANEGDADDVLGIAAEGSDVESGQLDTGRYPEVARRIVERFPNVRQVAITLRESISASHNNWGAMLYDVASGRDHFAPVSEGSYTPYQIRDIVDRIGGGDSFGAGLIFALNQPELEAPEKALRFAVAASCLAHSVEGDFNFSTRSEVEGLMAGKASGRVIR
ncbi:MAG: 2-dehydro-3-deoxygluconokinase [Akkermansiaceae bacterium]|jgi:2-dehydro-3-deoxygluconokinase